MCHAPVAELSILRSIKYQAHWLKIKFHVRNDVKLMRKGVMVERTAIDLFHNDVERGEMKRTWNLIGLTFFASQSNFM